MKKINRQFSWRKQKAKKETKLKTYIGDQDEAPEFMVVNKFIHRGYRINFDSYCKLIKSLFMIHNETVNVWTHLFGMIIFVYLIFHHF